MQYELTKGTYDERRRELGERPGEFKKNDRWEAGIHLLLSHFGMQDSKNLKPLIAFFKQECVKTWDSALKREMKDVDAKKSGIEAGCKESLKEILEAVEKGENSIV